MQDGRFAMMRRMAAIMDDRKNIQASSSPVDRWRSGLPRRFQISHAFFQLHDLFTCPVEDGALGVEFLAGDKVEAAQSVRQHIPEIGFHVVPRLRQSWRNQSSQPMRELVYGVHVDHVVASMRPEVMARGAPCLSVDVA
jgi:hypothetical protein